MAAGDAQRYRESRGVAALHYPLSPPEQFVCLRRHYEVIVVQSADLVRPPRDRDLAPLGKEGRMVSFLVCLLAYPACELGCSGEVVEPKASFQLLCAVALDDLPLGHLLL
jgi:hypothetical protein